MERVLVFFTIAGVVVLASMGMAWTQFLEHQRRAKTLDVIKAALEHGKEPPSALYQELMRGASSRQPWTEVVVLGSLAFGFWLAFAQSEGERRTVFLVVAATMTAAALGCLALGLLARRPGGGGQGAPRDDA